MTTPDRRAQAFAAVRADLDAAVAELNPHYTVRIRHGVKECPGIPGEPFYIDRYAVYQAGQTDAVATFELPAAKDYRNDVRRLAAHGWHVNAGDLTPVAGPHYTSGPVTKLTAAEHADAARQAFVDDVRELYKDSRPLSTATTETSTGHAVTLYDMHGSRVGGISITAPGGAQNGRADGWHARENAEIAGFLWDAMSADAVRAARYAGRAAVMSWLNALENAHADVKRSYYRFYDTGPDSVHADNARSQLADDRAVSWVLDRITMDAGDFHGADLVARLGAVAVELTEPWVTAQRGEFLTDGARDVYTRLHAEMPTKRRLLSVADRIIKATAPLRQQLPAPAGN